MVTFKKVGAYAILGVIVSGLITFIPPMYQASSFVFNMGSKYSEMQTTIKAHGVSLGEHQNQINNSRSDMREFRSVWCYDRLAARGSVSPHVLKACSEWIKSP